MNVVYASDDKFAEIMGVSILSLFENNKDLEKINVYIFDGNIDGENKERLKSLACSYNRAMEFISMQEIKSELSRFVQDRGSEAQFARLFVSCLLPEDCERCLYLDCDTLIRHSLRSFYETDFEENIVCGVMDCISKQHRRKLGIGEKDIYINSGVMLIDLNAWRKNCIEYKIIEIVKSFNGRIPYADQGLINLALRGKIKTEHPRYNCTLLYSIFSFSELQIYRCPSVCLSRSKIEEAKRDPSIIHFCSLFCISRPWCKGNGPFFEEWLNYKRKSPWKNEPSLLDQRCFFQKLGAAFYRAIPRKISLAFLGFLHARIKPLLKTGI